jgi:hypothetical protein
MVFVLRPRFAHRRPDAKTVDDHKVTVTAWSGTITNEATFKLSIKKK